jgi:hypothetical protein
MKLNLSCTELLGLRTLSIVRCQKKETEEYYVSETGSVSVLRSMGQYIQHIPSSESFQENLTCLYGVIVSSFLPTFQGLGSSLQLFECSVHRPASTGLALS